MPNVTIDLPETVFRPEGEPCLFADLWESGEVIGQEWVVKGTVNDRPAKAYFKFSKQEAQNRKPGDLCDVHHLHRIEHGT
jgi:hypothetical protein